MVDSGSMSPTYGIGLSAPSLTKPPHVMLALGFMIVGLSGQFWIVCVSFTTVHVDLDRSMSPYRQIFEETMLRMKWLMWLP